MKNIIIGLIVLLILALFAPYLLSQMRLTFYNTKAAYHEQKAIQEQSEAIFYQKMKCLEETKQRIKNGGEEICLNFN